MSVFKKNANETAFVEGQKHWTDVIKNTGPGDVLLWRQPEEDFNVNSTLVVMPGEEAIFIKGGNIYEVFESGTYELSTENYPFISRLRTAFSGGVSTFNCVVYFVRKAHTQEIKWGTDSALQVRDKILGIATKIGARGIYKVQIDNPSIFLEKLIGANIDVSSSSELDNYFAQQFQSEIKTVLTQALLEREAELLGIEAQMKDLSAEIEPSISNIVSGYGLRLISFVISGMDIDDNELRRKYDEIGMDAIKKIKEAQAEGAAMGILAQGKRSEYEVMGDEYWTKYQTAGILKDLANNEGSGGVASMGAGLGVGVATAGVFTGMANQFMNSMNQTTGINNSGIQIQQSDRFVQKNQPDSNADKSEHSIAEKLSPTEAMEQLKKMLAMELISQEEFDKKKQEILDRM